MSTPELTVSAKTPVVDASASQPPQSRRAALYTGRVLAGLVIAFLVFDVSLKVFAMKPAVDSFADLGYPASSLAWIGAFELVCLVLYVIPRTAPLGALLWTGYLGGAVATHVRLAHPLGSHVLFPIYVAVFLWLPIYLRDARLRALVGSRAPTV